MREVEVPVLVVGAGGAGLAATLFLADLGVEALIIERHAATSNLPKAHYINQRSMEIFRHHNVAEAIYAKAAPRNQMAKACWLTSLGGDGPFDGITFREQDALGAGASIRGAYDSKGCASPTNIPQIRFEPILRRVLEERTDGLTWFRHEMTGIRQDATGVTASVRDLERGEDVEIHCQYLVGADAGRTVGPALGIDRVELAGDRTFHWRLVWIAADLSSYITRDDAVMRFIYHPSTPGRMGGMLAFGPTHWDGRSEEWGVGVTIDPDHDSDEEIIAGVADFLKIDVPFEVLGVSRWHLKAVLAETFSRGRVILIGDAAHQHPPMAGLGLNSGIQDAHNLAWKLALVLGGHAPPSLLGTFEIERRPVIRENSDWSLFSMSNYATLLSALGAPPGSTSEQAEASFAQLMADTRIGRARRATIAHVFDLQGSEVCAHDLEMGFSYASGALVDDGSPLPWRDPLGTEYRPTSRPGCRLPHAWLDEHGKRTSTHDLIPMGGLLLLTGPRGNSWCAAAEGVAAARGLSLRAVIVGGGGDADDPTGVWASAKEIDDDGAILVRPDGHVGYRSRTAVADPAEALGRAVDTIVTGTS